MKILITGGTGSLGQGLIARWKDEHDLTILSRNPHKQQMVQAKFNLDPSVFILADICDYETVKNACIGQDVLIHAAALKVVSQGEQFPDEYHRVNVLGSQTVARAWAATHHRWNLPSDPRPLLPRKAIYINSDKAVSPINTYGLTKKLGEAFFINHGFSSIRYGNVVESEGSFIHKWKDLARRGRPIPVRYPHPTRFFLSTNEAVTLIEATLAAMHEAGDGIYIPANLPAFSVYEVAKAFTNLVNICERSLEPGEKQHEVLLQPSEIAAKLRNFPKVFKVKSGWSSSANCFSSVNALRIDGPEVLKRLGVSPQQEVFT